MIISAAALLRENPDPTEDDVRKALAGNLCRCTGYRQIVDAVHAAAAEMRAAAASTASRRREARRARGGDGVTAARSVGTDVPRVDGLEKVTGAAQYTADLKFPRLLHVAVVRSPHPHARVLDVRTEKASRMPGVRAVVSGRDFPLHTGIYLKDQTVFATDRVRFVGDPVAAVAAETPEAAAEAAAARRGRLRAAPADLRRRGGDRRGRARSSTPTSGATRSSRGSSRRPGRTSATT